MTFVDTITQWRGDWSSASVLNHTIVTDPTIRQPGFDLPRNTWSLMNRFRTGQGPYRANLFIVNFPVIVVLVSVVNKDLTFKAKAKAKDLTSEQVEGPL